jgi:hypothetical protein
MWNRLTNRNLREQMAGFLLAALVLQAVVPVGFMPATDRPFSLEICPAGYRTQLNPHASHEHAGDHETFKYCPFGTAPAPGPIAQMAVLPPSWLIAHSSVSRVESLRLSVRLDPAHQPRAPPALA